MNPEFGYGSKARGFWIVRRDGSETDFSYKKCLEGERVYHNTFVRACRFAIKDYIEAFKSDFFRVAIKPTCGLTGIPLTPNDCHVDHTPPFTFDRIVQAFAVLHGLDMNDPCLTIRGVDGLVVPTFSSEMLREQFILFHNAFAQLRVISIEANLSLVKTTTLPGVNYATS